MADRIDYDRPHRAVAPVQDVTFLFTDIEGSTRLWEEQPERMRHALAHHDEVARAAVAAHDGRIVKSTGDGIHAAFDDAASAVAATLALQRGLPQPDHGLRLRVRCGLHAGVAEGRDGDYYGSSVNRAARVMSSAHGGQVLLSSAVAERVQSALPEGCGLLDLGTLRLRDLAQPEHVFQLLHAELEREFPPLRSLERTPNNLPLELSSFVGRERELREVSQRLAQARLATIVGMGGLGKSRLALHAAAELLDDYADGAWLVELGPLADGARVPQAIASALRVKAEAGASVEEALLRHVRDRRLLLVLDNCEHVLDGVREAVRKLLSTGPHVRVLATSRELLRLPGEATYALGGLAVPGPFAAQSLIAIEEHAAVRLFVERATAAVPSFALDESNATLVAAICHRLNGIPLALELAAARLRSLALAQVAQRLDDRFRLLTTGDPTALPRQRTLRATIDWSHDMLSDFERAAFRRLAVFAGSWTLEAAEAVCSGDDVAPEDVLDLVARLVERSLVATLDGAERYRLLETVRDYAQQRLVDAGEADATRLRHLAQCVAFCEAAKPHLAGNEQALWLGALDAERDNVLAAHAFAAQANAELGLRLLNALKLYWVKRGLLELAEGLFTEALARPGLDGASRIRGQALFHRGQIRYFMGREDAEASLLEALAIARSLGDPRGLASILQSLASVATAKGDFATAAQRLEEAVALARDTGDRGLLAGALTAAAMDARVRGELSLAREHCDRVVALGRELRDAETEGIGQVNLAMVMLELGAADQAAMVVRELVHADEAALSRTVLQGLLDLCAGLAMAREDWKLGVTLCGAAEAHQDATGLRRDRADTAFLEPKAARGRAALGALAPVFEDEGRALAPAQALARARALYAGAREQVTAAADPSTSR